MELLRQQIATGIATGAIYALLALALVMIYQAIGHINFAQGEMATFSTFVAWQLMQWELPYWTAVTGAVVISFGGGILVNRLVFKPVRSAPVLTQIVMFVGVLAVLNSAAGFIWDFSSKSFPPPFGVGPLLGTRILSTHQATILGATFLLLVSLYMFFRYTRVGLAMQSATENPASAKLVGIRVERMIALGWGMAAAIGALAGMLIAPVVFLEPNMMLGMLLYGFAAAVLGGLSSPGGAVLGGFIVGIIENLAGTYVPAVGGELKLTIALVIIIGVLAFRPAGLFGATHTERV
ncbi:branched-chain amino acid ABC transporter permease [Bradyrhizobium sp. USDA 4454]